MYLRFAIFPLALQRLDVLNPQSFKFTSVGNVINCLNEETLLFRLHLFDVAPCDGSLLGIFLPSPCTLFGLCHSYGEMLAFLKMMNLFWNHSSFILCDHHCCEWRPSPALPVATELITSLILKEDSTVSTAYLASHFQPVIIAGCALSTLWVHRVTYHLEKSSFTELKFPQQVTSWVVSVSLMNCIMSLLLRI